MSPEAAAILAEVRALAEIAEPSLHAQIPAESFVDRVNALDGRAPLLLHGPVCNGLTMLRCAAQELLAATAACPDGADGAAIRPPRGRPAAPARFSWLLVVGSDEVLVALAHECAAELTAPLPVEAAGDLESARSRLARERRSGIVLTNLTLPSSSGIGPHGLLLATEARQRRHAVLVVTAAADYLGYWGSLAEAGLTGHDVIIKTQRNFRERLRRRVREIAEPTALGVSYDEETGHVMRIGDVEVTRLEGQEALVLQALDSVWRSSEAIADACGDTALAPTPGSVPPLISTLRTKIARALVDAESPFAQREVIEGQRREGWPTRYRLAPWLRWQDPPEPDGAARFLPPVLVIEDDTDWASWVAGRLGEWGWPARIAQMPEDVLPELDGGETPILVTDLALADPRTGLPDPEVGLRFVEEVALRRPGVRVIVLSAFGWRDTVLARLFDAGVRMVDVIDKAGDRDERAAVLLASLHRVLDETRRGVRLQAERTPLHQVRRVERRRIEVDGRQVERLTEREAAIVDELIRRAGLPVRADYMEAACFPMSDRPRSGPAYNPLNKVHSAVSRLRRKIDAAAATKGVGEAVIRTPHMGARTTYELHGLVIDLVPKPAPDRELPP
jgi:DNA-binding response OmpR family regulator